MIVVFGMLLEHTQNWTWSNEMSDKIGDVNRMLTHWMYVQMQKNEW